MSEQRKGVGERLNHRRQIFLVVILSMVGGASSTAWHSAAGQTARERRVTDPTQSAPQQTQPKQGQPEQNPKPATPQQPSQPKQDPQKPGKATEKAPEIDAEPIRINSNLVAVPVSVTDVNGQPVRGLKAEDFELIEEGQIQQLQTLGEPGKTPIELALLFDVSRSVRNRFDFEREAAGRFLKQVLKQGDSVSVFAIGTTPKLAVVRTGNVDKAIADTQVIQPTDEATAFFDTTVRSARYLDDNGSPGARKVMVVISDGEDTNSERFRLGDAQREIQRSDILFYAINPSGPSIRLNKISMRGHDGMVKLSNETGGVAFLPDKLEDLQQVFNQIANELQAQYLLGYYSTNEKNDGQFRRISVKVSKRADLRIRARQGYYSPKE